MRAKLKAVLIVVAGAIAMMATNVEAADTGKIGMVAPLTGPGAFSGQLQSQGFRLAVDEVNKAGGILGRQIEAAIEDDQTTNPGAVLAFSKLAGDKDIVAFIGPIRSTQIHAMDRKSTRLNSSPLGISYSVFCLQKTQHTAPLLFVRRPTIPPPPTSGPRLPL